MKIGITAASGQLGRAIVRQVVADYGTDNVIGIVRTPERAADLGIEIRAGDYNSKESYLSALDGVDVVILISGMDAPDQRIIQHRNVIEAASEKNVRKIIYTSIFGESGRSAFDPIIQSNRQTETDIRNSGMEWIIGRNGLYIDADLESLEDYKKAGKIMNCAGEGKCAYTSRRELGLAYSRLIGDDSFNNAVYNLCGEPVTQQELTSVINRAYGLDLVYQSMSVKDYLRDRIAAHGESFGTIIAGIYEGIRNGAFEVESDFSTVMGRPHLTLCEMIEAE